jgi:hypothetical protein
VARSPSTCAGSCRSRAGLGQLSFQAGFRLDNIAKSADNAMNLFLQDRVSLGVSDFNAAFGGAHLQFPAGPKAWIVLEGSLEAFLGDPPAGHAPLAEGTLLIRGGASAGFHINPTWSAIAFLEAAKVPGIEMAQVTANNIPLIPYEPAVTGGLGIQARFGGPKATYIEKDCHKHTPPDCEAVKVPLLADLSGTVVDEAGKPVVGARVSFTLKNSQVPAQATRRSTSRAARRRRSRRPASCTPSRRSRRTTTCGSPSARSGCSRSTTRRARPRSSSTSAASARAVA